MNRTALFSYDLFPYVVIHNQIGWSEKEGDPILKGNFSRSRESLIATLSIEDYSRIEKALSKAKETYEEAVKEANEAIVSKLCSEVPQLTAYYEKKKLI